MSSRLDSVTNWETEGRGAGYDPARLAAAREISLRRLEQYFQKRFHAAPRVWLAHLRMRDARAKIQEGAPAKAVGIDLGFKHSPNFHRAFRHEFGCTPGHFRLAGLEAQA